LRRNTIVVLVLVALAFVLAATFYVVWKNDRIDKDDITHFSSEMVFSQRFYPPF